MEREEIEYIVALIDITVTNTLSKLDLIPENLSEPKAHKIYGEKMIVKWRQKGWIVAYPSANKKYAKVYYKRSECEKASRMMESSGLPKKSSSPSLIIDEIRKQVIESLEISAAKEKARAIASKKKTGINNA